MLTTHYNVSWLYGTTLGSTWQQKSTLYIRFSLFTSRYSVFFSSSFLLSCLLYSSNPLNDLFIANIYCKKWSMHFARIIKELKSVLYKSLRWFGSFPQLYNKNGSIIYYTFPSCTHLNQHFLCISNNIIWNLVPNRLHWD